MEFCVHWNQFGSTCECDICLGPWIETRLGFWRHAFDPLLFSHIQPLRNAIEYEDEEPEVCVREDSPVSSISDQYSTDATFSIGSMESSTTDTYSDSTASSDGVLAASFANLTISDTDSESLVMFSESEISDEENLFNSLLTPEDINEAWELVHDPPAKAEMSPESADEHDTATCFAFSGGTGYLVDWGNRAVPPNSPDPVYYYKDPKAPQDDCRPNPKKVSRHS
jgi:hypothetical protein